jgi:hypothetical protein
MKIQVLKRVILGATILGFTSTTAEAAIGKLVAADIHLQKGEEWTIQLPEGLMQSVQILARPEVGEKLAAKTDSLTWWMDLRNDAYELLSRIKVASVRDLNGYEDQPRTVVVETANERYASSANSSGYSCLTLKNDDRGGYELWSGGENLQYAATFPLRDEVRTITVAGSHPLGIATVNLGIVAEKFIQTGWTESSITEYLKASTDPHEGIYEYLDSDIDTDLARRGGSYRLGVVKNSDNGYDIIYISGADANHIAWQPGMIIGELTPTIFSNQYNLLWHDAEDATDLTELWAIVNGTLMELHFPTERATMRFSRCQLK